MFKKDEPNFWIQNCVGQLYTKMFSFDRRKLGVFDIRLNIIFMKIAKLESIIRENNT